MAREMILPMAAVRRAWFGGAETIAEIAARFGVCDGSISRLAKKQGWPPKSRRNKRAILTVEGVAPLVEAGLLNAEIGARFGVTAEAIGQFRWRHGLTRARAVRQFGPELIEMWRFGLPIHDIAKHFKAHRGTIRRALRDAGEPERPHTGRKALATMAQWAEHKLAERMQAAARETRAAMKAASMLDLRPGEKNARAA